MSVRSSTLTKIELKPGMVADDTALASEGTFTALQWVRARRGRMEVMPGYTALTGGTFTGICRGAHTWATLDGTPVLGYGTHTKLYGYMGTTNSDITPPKSEGWLAVTPIGAATVGVFSTVNGSPTVTVLWSVYDPDAGTANIVPHNLVVGDTVDFTKAYQGSPATVGGLTITGTYTVASVINAYKFTITHGLNATSTATGKGEPVYWRASFPSGNQNGPSPRVWSVGNFGGDLLANPSGIGIYKWQPAASFPELRVATWVHGTGWGGTGASISGSAGTASNSSQVAEGVLEGGTTYRVTFTLTSASSATSNMYFRVDSINLSAPINRAGNYSFVFECPANPLLWGFAKDNAWDGTISSISLKKEAVAFWIPEAPARVNAMFVDPNGICFALGAYEVDGDYNPMVVRGCDRQNIHSWVPDNNNLAFEEVLGIGGKLVGGLPSRQQNLIWSDVALYTATFTGDATQPYTFKLMGRGCGLLGKNAAAEHNGSAFWMANSGNFYIFQGAVPQIIDCPVRDEVFNYIPINQVEKVYAYVNTENTEVWWLYPDSRDGAGLECSRYVAFNWIENTWIMGMLDRTAGVSSGVFEYPMLFSSGGTIYQHEKGDNFNGGALSWSAETGYFDIEDGGNLMQLSGYVPDFKNLQGTLSLYIYTRPSPNGAELTFGPYTVTTSTEFAWFRSMGRQVKLKFVGTGTPASARFGAQRFYVKKSGARR